MIAEKSGAKVIADIMQSINEEIDEMKKIEEPINEVIRAQLIHKGSR
ncbi:MAG: hypothetical protein ACTSRS_16565 [Candidatus Helarchaeota archaeon]